MIDDFTSARRPAAAPARIPNTASIQTNIPRETVPKDDAAGGKPMADKPRKRTPAWLHKPKNKKQWAMLVAALIIVFGAGGTVFAMLRKKPAPAVTPVAMEEPKPQEPPKPVTEPSRLTGIEVAPELNKRPVTGVMIENSPDARPQSGLKEAGIIFEAVAEGGITRFLALYQESQPAFIGPIRSARPYYLDWLAPFDAGLAHVGGSPEALAQLRDGSLKDLDQFFNAGAFHRVSNRYAPHNVYTSMAALDALNQQKGFTSSTFTSFPRSHPTDASPLAATPPPPANKIDLTISSYLYNVHYDYDAASTTYKRSEGGRPHLDEKSAAQLSPHVVVVLVMGKGVASGGLHTTYATHGTGQLFVFQGGSVLQGNWQKTDRKSQFVFTDSNGATLKLNPGQTWITVVNLPGSVSHAP